MRPFLTLLASALLGTGISACGDSSKSTTSQGASNRASNGGALVQTSNTSTVNNDRDNDRDHNNDDEHVLDFGHVANAADNQAITALVTHYYAAAASENGTKACALLAPFMAESVAEEYGHSLPLRGKTCATVLSKLFKQHHRDLASKEVTLKVMRVGIEGDRSLVALEFPAIPEVRQITARRIGGSWKILALLDDNLE